MSFYARYNHGVTGLVGHIFYRIVDTSDNSEAVARTATGVVEDGTTGEYVVAVDDAYKLNRYAIHWDKDGELPGASEQLGAYADAPTADAVKTALEAEGSSIASLVDRNNPMTAAETRAALGMGAANMDTQLTGIAADAAAAAGDVPAGYTRVTSATYGTLLPGTVVDAYDYTDTARATALVDNVTVASNGSWFIDLPDAGHYVLVGRLLGKNDVEVEVTT